LNKYGQAHYDLDEIKNLLDDPNKRIVTRASRLDAVSLGYAGPDDMVERVKLLKKTEIYKTMEAEKKPGLWQDVYVTEDCGVGLYIKLQKSCDGKGVIISFKKK
jgi:hypothetical protein